ncbi:MULTISPECIES: hypothetical protein [unclassified Rhizobium]|uniref:hypothetical protein n=1 Tax=unclassified Rhizobium TaxID=2613769 RepID=UPI0028893643|nr:MULTISPECIES: hypothetical protein [unclassified Rhizobium]
MAMTKTTTGKATTVKTGKATMVKTEAAKPAVATGEDSAAGIAAASEFAPSGVPIQSVPDVDPSHIAVDADPRKGTSETQNRIDFNDPTLTGREAVEQNQKTRE